MDDFGNDIGMASYALLSDIDNWTDLAREEAARELLIKDAPEVIEAIEKLLLQLHTMISANASTAQHQTGESTNEALTGLFRRLSESI